MVTLSAQSDAAGRARFAHVPAGLVVIQAGGIEETLVVPTGGEVAFIAAESARVVGVLKDGHGRSVPGVTLELQLAVELHRIARVSVVTDLEGRFEFDSVPPGAFHSAYVYGRGAVDVAGRFVWSGETIEWEPRLPSGRTLAGRVETHDGEAVPGAVVTVAESGDEIGRCVADPSGEFEIRAPGDGPFVIHARAFGLLGSVSVDSEDVERVVVKPCSRVVGQVNGLAESSRAIYTVTLKANGFERSIALDAHGRFAFEHVPPLRNAQIRCSFTKRSGRFDVGMGQVIEVKLDRRPMRTVHGTVKTQDGTPVVGALVRASSLYGFFDMALTQPAWPGNTVTDQDGAYRAKVNFRTWHIRVAHQGFIPAESQKLPATKEPDDIQRDIVLRRGKALAGTVLWADGSPMRHACVIALFAGGGFRHRRTAMTDASGRFRLQGLDTGKYKVTAVNAAGSIAVTQDCDAGRMDVSLRVEQAGIIEGIVVDDRGFPCRQTFATSVVAGDQSSRIGPGGRFRIAGLAPGHYDVSVEDMVDEGISTMRNVKTGTVDVVLRYGRQEFDIQVSADGDSVETTSTPVR
ncbi:MAG: carboxypeptidase regulatory-like domain-containing protein [Planctomycetota bacterium]